MFYHGHGDLPENMLMDIIIENSKIFLTNDNFIVSHNYFFNVKMT